MLEETNTELSICPTCKGHGDYYFKEIFFEYVLKNCDSCEGRGIVLKETHIKFSSVSNRNIESLSKEIVMNKA